MSQPHIEKKSKIDECIYKHLLRKEPLFVEGKVHNKKMLLDEWAMDVWAVIIARRCYNTKNEAMSLELKAYRLNRGV